MVAVRAYGGKSARTTADECVALAPDHRGGHASHAAESRAVRTAADLGLITGP
jgi:hypothetical protein